MRHRRVVFCVMIWRVPSHDVRARVLFFVCVVLFLPRYAAVDARCFFGGACTHVRYVHTCV